MGCPVCGIGALESNPTPALTLMSAYMQVGGGGVEEGGKGGQQAQGAPQRVRVSPLVLVVQPMMVVGLQQGLPAIAHKAMVT